MRGNAIRDALVAAGVPKESLTVTENVGGGAATGAVVVNWKDYKALAPRGARRVSGRFRTLSTASR